jgi:Mob1/phocein family
MSSEQSHLTPYYLDVRSPAILSPEPNGNHPGPYITHHTSQRISDTPFPDSFLSTAKQIFTRLFRVYAIVYSEHMEVIEDMGAAAHLNTSLTHLLYFCWELDLLRSEEEDVIKCIVESIRQQYMETSADVGVCVG